MQEKLYNQLVKHGIEVKTDKVEVKCLKNKMYNLQCAICSILLFKMFTDISIWQQTE